jgi:transposase-like protein
MYAAEFSKLLHQISTLSSVQKDNISQYLEGETDEKYITHWLEQRLVDSPQCPHCQSTEIKRHGKSSDMQRYQCKQCHKTFMPTTNTPLYRLRNKNKWLHYFQTMCDSKALRVAARECEINLKTSFRWRHRFLSVPADTMDTELEGIIEVDETLFRYSEKGSKHLTRRPRKRGTKASKPGRSRIDWVPVLTARDRGKHTIESILPEVTSKQLVFDLKGRVVKDSVLCSDGYRAYIQCSKELNLIHKRLDVAGGVRVLEGVFHIQNVNALHSRLKEWMAKFHGVATKYLDHYLGWHRLFESQVDMNKFKMLYSQQHLKKT